MPRGKRLRGARLMAAAMICAAVTASACSPARHARATPPPSDYLRVGPNALSRALHLARLVSSGAAAVVITCYLESRQRTRRRCQESARRTSRLPASRPEDTTATSSRGAPPTPRHATRRRRPMSD
jgi:hypothetical protein